jgi:hypothetical protein
LGHCGYRRYKDDTTHSKTHAKSEQGFSRHCPNIKKAINSKIDAVLSGKSFRTMLHRVETNVFFEQAIYLVLFASNAGGV